MYDGNWKKGYMHDNGKFLDSRNSNKKLILEGKWTKEGRVFEGRVRFIANIDGQEVVINDLH